MICLLQSFTGLASSSFTILLSSSSGIISFLASSEYFKDYNLIFTITVGVASSITTLFQSFSNAFE